MADLQRGKSECLRQNPFSLKICRPWGQCAVTGTVLSAQGSRWGTGVRRAQWALAVGSSAVGTKTRMTPGILKVVECKSTWRPVLPAVEREILNTKPDWLVQGFPLKLPALQPCRPGERSCRGSACSEGSVLAAALREAVPSGCSGGSGQPQAVCRRSRSVPHGCGEVGDVRLCQPQMLWRCSCSQPAAVLGDAVLRVEAWIGEESEGCPGKAGAGENPCLEALCLTLSSH